MAKSSKPSFTLKFKCPECGKALSESSHLAGKQAECPGCKSPISIPAPWYAKHPCLAAFVVFGVISSIIAIVIGITAAATPAPTHNEQGVPMEIVNAIEQDIAHNQREYDKRINAKHIIWLQGDHIYPATGEINKYWVYGKVIGKTTIYGTHQEGRACLFYMWNPETKTILCQDVRLLDSEWKDN